MNKKAFQEDTIKILLWIVFFIIILFAVTYLVKFLTGG